MYGVHVDVFTDHKSLQYVFTQKELNIRQRIWLDLLKDYDINILYHPGKANMVMVTLCRMTIGSVSHIDEAKKDLVRDVHRFARLGMTLEDSSNCGFMVHDNSESSLVVEMMFKKHLEKSLMELKEMALSKINEAFSLRGDGILRCQRRLCVPKVYGLRERIIEENHGSCYSINQGSTKIYHDLREIY